MAPPRPPGGTSLGKNQPPLPTASCTLLPSCKHIQCFNSVWGTISPTYGLITFCLQMRNTQKTWKMMTDGALSCCFLFLIVLFLSMSQMKSLLATVWPNPLITLRGKLRPNDGKNNPCICFLLLPPNNIERAGAIWGPTFWSADVFRSCGCKASYSRSRRKWQSGKQAWHPPSHIPGRQWWQAWPPPHCPLMLRTHYHPPNSP